MPRLNPPLSTALMSGSLLALALLAQTPPPPGLRDSPPLNKTWRLTAHNAIFNYA